MQFMLIKYTLDDKLIKKTHGPPQTQSEYNIL